MTYARTLTPTTVASPLPIANSGAGDGYDDGDAPGYLGARSTKKGVLPPAYDPRRLTEIAASKRDGTFAEKRRRFNIENTNAANRRYMDETGNIVTFETPEQWNNFASRVSAADPEFDPVTGYLDTQGVGRASGGIAESYDQANRRLMPETYDETNRRMAGSMQSSPVQRIGGVGQGAASPNNIRNDSGGGGVRNLGGMAGALDEMSPRELGAVASGLGRGTEQPGMDPMHAIKKQKAADEQRAYDQRMRNEKVRRLTNQNMARAGISHPGFGGTDFRPFQSRDKRPTHLVSVSASRRIGA